ncbi:hypothetical protein ACFVS7_32780 [Streptomyces rubiginosohelvolus]
MSDTETDTGIETAAVRPRLAPGPLHVPPSASPSVTAPTGGPLDV